MGEKKKTYTHQRDAVAGLQCRGSIAVNKAQYVTIVLAPL
jgi:hypothetical protein